jgi:hypothetical protein
MYVYLWSGGYFTIHLHDWMKMYWLACEYGWQPEGTELYVDEETPPWWPPSNYWSNSYQFVAPDDAQRFASALVSALVVIEGIDECSENVDSSALRHFSTPEWKERLREFIAFARRGDFQFMDLDPPDEGGGRLAPGDGPPPKPLGVVLAFDAWRDPGGFLSIIRLERRTKDIPLRVQVKEGASGAFVIGMLRKVIDHIERYRLNPNNGRIDGGEDAKRAREIQRILESPR